MVKRVIISYQKEWKWLRTEEDTDFDFIFNTHSGNQKFENFEIKKNIRVENLVPLENFPVKNQRSTNVIFKYNICKSFIMHVQFFSSSNSNFWNTNITNFILQL